MMVVPGGAWGNKEEPCISLVEGVKSGVLASVLLQDLCLCDTRGTGDDLGARQYEVQITVLPCALRSWDWNQRQLEALVLGVVLGRQGNHSGGPSILWRRWLSASKG